MEIVLLVLGILAVNVFVFRRQIQRVITLCELRVAAGNVTVVRGGGRT